jgi:hypothetical protein
VSNDFKKLSIEKYTRTIPWIYFLFLIYKICEITIGALNIGMNIDEPYHLNQAQLWLNNFFYISDKESGPSFTYGPLIGILQITFNSLVGNGNLNNYSNTPLFFELNHLLLTFIGLSASLILLSLNKSFKKWKSFGYLFSVILLSIPFWIGNSFHNMKDTPTAVGYTFVTLGCFFLLKSFMDNKLYLKYIFLIFIGFTFVLGTRPALLLPVMVSFIVTLFYLKFILRSSNLVITKIIIYTLIPTLVSFLILLPQFIQFPLKSLKETFFTSSNFPWNGLILTGGVLEKPVFTVSYFLKWYFAQTPIIFFILSILGLIYYFAKVVKNPRTTIFVASTLFFIQFALTPIFLLLTQAPIYNGLRHILFIYPSIAFFSTLGFYFLIESFQNKKNILLVALLVGIIAPNLESLRLMPYQQIYYNPAISFFYNVSTDWDTDYYGLSGREAFQHLPKNGELAKTSEWVWQEPAFLKERGLKTKDALLSDSDYWMTSGIYSYIDGDSRERMLNSNAPLEALKPTCSAEYVAIRKLRFETIPLSFVSRCQRSGKLLHGFASITWNSPTEVSEDQKPYFWLTTKGDSFRVTNITSKTISQNLTFSVFANPCLANTSFTVKVGNAKVIAQTPISQSEIFKVKIPIQIQPYKTSVIELVPAVNSECIPSNADKRNIVSGIMSINIKN